MVDRPRQSQQSLTKAMANLVSFVSTTVTRRPRESSSFFGHAHSRKPIFPSALLNSHSQQVSERVVFLDDLEGPGVRNFGVWSVGKPARAGGSGCDTKVYLPKVSLFREWVCVHSL